MSLGDNRNDGSLVEPEPVDEPELEQAPAESKLKLLKKIGASVLAALTSPEAVKAEKSIAVLVIARLAITVPAYAWLLDSLVKALS